MAYNACNSLRRGLPGRDDGAFRHGQSRSDARQSQLHAGFPAAERGRARRGGKGAADLSFDESDSVHRMPLLHRGLPEAHLDPRSVRASERQADSPRLERGLLLRLRAHLRGPQGVGLLGLRQMRADLPAASAGAHAFEG